MDMYCTRHGGIKLSLSEEDTLVIVNKIMWKGSIFFPAYR